MTQAEKADRLRQLHFDTKLLVLPNAWDPLSARVLETAGFPAVATGSVATALANGYEDGEKMPFNNFMDMAASIACVLSVPLTIDVEHGFASHPEELQSNIRSLIDHGVVGINLEDGIPGTREIESEENQCRRIEAVREAAEKSGVPLVINARTDLFLLRPGNDSNLPETINRTRAYIAAGADCVYPIMINQYEQIQVLVSETGVPVNVNLQKSVSDLDRLQNIGVARVSLGPGFLYNTLSRMLELATDLQKHQTSKYFETSPPSKDFLNGLRFRP